MSDEADLSAEQSGACAPARLPLADVNAGWPQGDPRASCPRAQQAFGLTAIAAADAVPLARLTERKFYLAANAGKRVPMPGFVLLVRVRDDSDPMMRIGITVSKKVGNAVIRNRMKRRFRMLAREVLPAEGLSGADHVLIGRNSGIERDYATLRAELVKALGKLKR
jgi:ribonuclease P protein component